LFTDDMPTSVTPKHEKYETSGGVHASRNFTKCSAPWPPLPACTTALQSEILPLNARLGAIT